VVKEVGGVGEAEKFEEAEDEEDSGKISKICSLLAELVEYLEENDIKGASVFLDEILDPDANHYSFIDIINIKEIHNAINHLKGEEVE
jgi:hypothetical protein